MQFKGPFHTNSRPFDQKSEVQIFPQSPPSLSTLSLQPHPHGPTSFLLTTPLPRTRRPPPRPAPSPPARPDPAGLQPPSSPPPTIPPPQTITVARLHLRSSPWSPRPTLAPTVGLHHPTGGALAAAPRRPATRHLRRAGLPPPALPLWPAVSRASGQPPTSNPEP
jgi:hypothetical protein